MRCAICVMFLGIIFLSTPAWASEGALSVTPRPLDEDQRLVESLRFNGFQNNGTDFRQRYAMTNRAEGWCGYYSGCNYWRGWGYRGGWHGGFRWYGGNGGFIP